jgi:hypothetical protein
MYDAWAADVQRVVLRFRGCGFCVGVFFNVRDVAEFDHGRVRDGVGNTVWGFDGGYRVYGVRVEKDGSAVGGGWVGDGFGFDFDGDECAGAMIARCRGPKA